MQPTAPPPPQVGSSAALGNRSKPSSEPSSEPSPAGRSRGKPQEQGQKENQVPSSPGTRAGRGVPWSLSGPPSLPRPALPVPASADHLTLGVSKSWARRMPYCPSWLHDTSQPAGHRGRVPYPTLPSKCPHTIHPQWPLHDPDMPMTGSTCSAGTPWWLGHPRIRCRERRGSGKHHRVPA